MHIYVDIGTGSNGGIIKWELPGTNKAIFEWDEDYKYGPHYHCMLKSWENQHDPNPETHMYRPNDPVPEPWRTTYFS